MKKLLAALLALVMILSLAACAGNTDPSTDKPNDTNNSDKTDPSGGEDGNPKSTRRSP